MKKFLLSLLIICSSYAAFAQLYYEKNYAVALQKSRATKKPIFLYFETYGNLPVSAFETGLNQPEAVAFYNANFTNVRVTTADPDARKLLNKYQIWKYPTYIFLDTIENLIFRTSDNNPIAKRYVDLGKEALDRWANGTSIFNYENQYANGKRDKAFLREYISLRIKSGTLNNAELADEYVKLLTIAELENPEEILFILRAGSFAYGKAYKLAYSNSKLASEVFGKLPLQERIDINNRIINNTLNSAIAKRDYQMAQSVASFTRGTHGTNYKEGERQYASKMLTYYKAVKDTSNFYRSAIAFNDQYYMTVSMDSIKRQKQKNQELMELLKSFSMKKAERKEIVHTDTTQQKRTAVFSRSVVVSTGLDNVANRLNTAAWEFYELGTRNVNNLGKALLWSKRSIEIEPNPAYYDTIAHIFYRLGLYDEAILNQTKSIKLSVNQPKFKAITINAKKELEKMKTRKL